MPGNLLPKFEENPSAPWIERPRATLRPFPDPAPWRRWVQPLLLALSVAFLALHFVHLKADFPNYSQWKDWAKYTDEGWYGDAAIRHYDLGHWNVPGDFNPAAALPVWPMLEMALFRVTGVSLTAARALSVAVFSLTLLACFHLLRLWRRRGNEPRGVSVAPGLTVLLLAVSPFCFVFTRLAILEPLLVLLTVLSMVVATYAGRATARREPDTRREFDPSGADITWRISRQSIGWALLLGVLLPLAVLTKTTAVFLVPAIAWILWAATGMRFRTFLPAAAVASTTAFLLWGGYYSVVVRPHLLVDYRYLFTANTYTGFRWNTLGSLLLATLGDAVWLGRPLFLLSLAGIVWALVRIGSEGLRRNPLLIALLLWILGYGAFLAYHANLQPRYYLVLAIPLTALVGLFCEWLLTRLLARKGRIHRAGVAVVLLAMAVTAGRAAQHTGYFLLHPQYTWLSAANRIRTLVDSDAQKGHSRLLLSISGSELSLMTGVPSICDDFGTLPLSDRVARYHPGWFATWNDMEDDKMEALAPLYRVQRVAAIPAFDDPDRNLLILYRLDPLKSPGAAAQNHHRRRHPVTVPRSLRTPDTEAKLQPISPP